MPLGPAILFLGVFNMLILGLGVCHVTWTLQPCTTVRLENHVHQQVTTVLSLHTEEHMQLDDRNYFHTHTSSHLQTSLRGGKIKSNGTGRHC